MRLKASSKAFKFTTVVFITSFQNSSINTIRTQHQNHHLSKIIITLITYGLRDAGKINLVAFPDGSPLPVDVSTSTHNFTTNYQH